MKRLMLLTTCVLLAGCGRSDPPPPVDDSRLATQAADMIDVPLIELLTKPRAELAAMGTELEKKLQMQLRAQREQRTLFLADWHPSIVVPGLRQAAYSANLDCSLPPYANEAEKDSPLAVHMAMHGDVEAARKLLDPTDSAAQKQIDSVGFQTNYPIEWTRLAGLLLQHGEFRIASGDADGLAELVALHKQVLKSLDAKAAQGTLGALLLPRGREVLQRAAKAWQANKKTEWAEKAESALQSWGAYPDSPQLALQGRAHAEMQKLLRTPSQNRAWLASSVLRTLDLLQLPFPEENAESILVWFDDSGTLGELLLTYRPGMAKYFPAPNNLALLLEERGQPGKDAPNSPGLTRRAYTVHGVPCDVGVLDHGASVGGFVRLQPQGATLGRSNLARDLGAFNLDRSFEQNRLVLAPQQKGDRLVIKQAAALAQLPAPIVGLKLGEADVYRAGDATSTDRLVLQFPMDLDGAPSLAKTALPAWISHGPPTLTGISGPSGGHLSLSWTDARTEHSLLLPYDDGQPVLWEVRSRADTAILAASPVFDKQERQARIKAGQPLSRLPRELAGVRLGIKRDQVYQALPPGKSVLKQDVPEGLMVTFIEESTSKESALLRQLLARLDGQGQIVELRGRYVTGAVPKGKDWTSDLLARLRKSGGVAQETSPTWNKLWLELPQRKPAPSALRWQDDVTAVNWQRDSGGLELTLKDCPLEHPDGAPLPPWRFLPAGPENLLVGIKRESLLAKLAGATPEKTSDGALILRPSESSPYDLILLWLDKDVVTRITARQKSSKPATTPALAAAALQETWGEQLATLGWPRRQDILPGGQLQGLGWHDDQTRIRIFWQENDAGVYQIFTEWRTW